MRATWCGSGPMEYAAVVQRETSGTPFFVGEVLRHLAEAVGGSELARWSGEFVGDDRGNQ